MHKFILGENPMAAMSGGLWIVHLPEPICIIEAVLSGEKIHSKKAIFKRDFYYENSDGIVEPWQLRMYHYFTTEFNEGKEAAALCDAMLNNAWQWYKSYLIWEDQNIDNEIQ